MFKISAILLFICSILFDVFDHHEDYDVSEYLYFTVEIELINLILMSFSTEKVEIEKETKL